MPEAVKIQVAARDIWRVTCYEEKATPRPDMAHTRAGVGHNYIGHNWLLERVGGSPAVAAHILTQRTHPHEGFENPPHFYACRLAKLEG